jgi:metal-sulfur cluster biosynthetic enzyme
VRSGQLDEPAVRRALEDVVDPCSVAAGTPLSLVAMGLVHSITMDDGAVSIELLLTGPGCLYGGLFADAVRREVTALPGVRSVDVRLVTDDVWEPARMSEDARLALARTRSRTVELSRVRPVPAGSQP